MISIEIAIAYVIVDNVPAVYCDNSCDVYWPTTMNRWSEKPKHFLSIPYPNRVHLNSLHFDY